MRVWRRKWWSNFAAGVGGATLGAVFGRLLPPFVLDDPFWRSFWVSPAVGGLAAVAAAGIAFGAAWQTVRASSRGARRQEWWYRAEWALNLAVADEGKARDVGIRVLEVLNKEATETEAQILEMVTAIYFVPQEVAEEADGFPD
ncbi:hypothetical protein GCM10009715_32430 [Paeniglutamicibacter psychrophenolicus]